MIPLTEEDGIDWGDTSVDEERERASSEDCLSGMIR